MPGENLGFLRIGVKGDVLVVCRICIMACEHCFKVFPIRGCIFNLNGMESQHQSVLFMGMEDWSCSICAHNFRSCGDASL